MITRLVKLANILDQKGLYNEASQIDEIIRQAIMEWEQPGDEELNDPDSRTHPYSEEYMGSGEEAEPYKPSKPSEESRIMALKHKLLKAYGKEYGPLLTEDVLKRLLSTLGMPDITYYGSKGNGGLWDKQMKFLLFDDRMRRNECISCGGETPDLYLEKGEDVASSPMCNNCFRDGVDEIEEEYLKGTHPELLENLSRFFIDIKDPSDIENEHGDFGSDEDDFDYLSPEDDDYVATENKRVMPNRREMAELWR